MIRHLQGFFTKYLLFDYSPQRRSERKENNRIWTQIYMDKAQIKENKEMVPLRKYTFNFSHFSSLQTLVT